MSILHWICLYVCTGAMCFGMYYAANTEFFKADGDDEGDSSGARIAAGAILFIFGWLYLVAFAIGVFVMAQAQRIRQYVLREKGSSDE